MLEVTVYGVSPAYFISRFGDRFTPHQVAESLRELKELGYDAYQLEVFHPDSLEEWATTGTELVVAAGGRQGLAPSQFVAHFLLHAFGSPAALTGSFGIPELERCLQMLVPVDDCRIISVPLPGFEVTTVNDVEPGAHDSYFTALVEKVGRMCELAASAGFRLAIELMPGALISGSDGFLRLCDALPSCDLAYNLDTGHAWSQKEPVELIASKLGDRISGTHLCDNDGGVNESLAPGRGTINWPLVAEALRRAGYSGSWDVEIKCPARDVSQQYSDAIEFLKEVR